jgi:hypothetical protein
LQSFLFEIDEAEIVVHEAKIAGGNTARVYNFDVARLIVPA